MAVFPRSPGPDNSYGTVSRDTITGLGGNDMLNGLGVGDSPGGGGDNDSPDRDRSLRQLEANPSDQDLHHPGLVNIEAGFGLIGT
jgi:hypothetical protein